MEELNCFVEGSKECYFQDLSSIILDNIHDDKKLGFIVYHCDGIDYV